MIIVISMTNLVNLNNTIFLIKWYVFYFTTPHKGRSQYEDHKKTTMAASISPKEEQIFFIVTSDFLKKKSLYFCVKTSKWKNYFIKRFINDL